MTDHPTASQTAHLAAPRVSRCPFASLVTRETKPSLASQLKESTKALHHAAEHHPLQQSIVRGTISRVEYADFARALRSVHESMERALNELAVGDARVKAIFLPRHQRLEAFDRDIALLTDAHAQGHDQFQRVAANPVDWISGDGQRNVLSWLGVLYVLEGSSNGGQVIARVLRNAWNLNDDTLKSLDPHSKHTREYWSEFRTTLDSQQFSAAEQDTIVRGAAATFRGITELMDAFAVANAAVK